MNREEKIRQAAETFYPDDATFRKIFEFGAGLASKLIIEKACEWLEENLAKETSVIGNGNVTIKFRGTIEAFKKAMEE